VVTRHLVDKPVFVLIPLPLELALFQQAVLGYPSQHPRPCQILADADKEVVAGTKRLALPTDHRGRIVELGLVAACLRLYVDLSIPH